MSDPIGDMLIRIKNGYMAKREIVEIPFSNFKETLAELLFKYGFIGEVVKTKDSKKFSVKLIYKDGVPAMTDIKRVSKPGLRRYIKVRELINMKQSLGYLIISTPNGLMTHKDAKKNKFGGEILCKIW